MQSDRYEPFGPLPDACSPLQWPSLAGLNWAGKLLGHTQTQFGSDDPTVVLTGGPKPGGR
jgi:hypothetical protein